MKIRLPKIIVHDILRKLVALFFAIILWLAIHHQLRDTQKFSRIPVVLVYDTGKLVITSKPILIDVTLLGSKNRLDSINANDITIEIPMPEVADGVHSCEIRITPNEVKAPTFTSVADFKYITRIVQFDKIIHKKDIPISVKYDGKLDDGYKLRTKIIPETTTIIGPSKFVENIHELITEPIILDQSITKNFKMHLKIKNNYLREGVSTSEKEVVVEVIISKTSDEKIFYDLPINKLESETGELEIASTIPAISVTVQGPVTSLEKLEKLSVIPFIDLTNVLTEGEHRLPIKVWINDNENIKATYINPQIITVILKKRNKQPLPTNNNPIENKP